MIKTKTIYHSVSEKRYIIILDNGREYLTDDSCALIVLINADWDNEPDTRSPFYYSIYYKNPNHDYTIIYPEPVRKKKLILVEKTEGGKVFYATEEV